MMNVHIETEAGALEDINEQMRIRREKLLELQAAGRDPFAEYVYDVSHYSTGIKDDFENLEGKNVSIAGRIMNVRGMGKASFCDIQDMPGRIQAYVRLDVIGEEAYEDFKGYDIGDIIGIEGIVFKTRMGEISVKAHSVVLLAKALRPLPEKFHGLKDTELRYRQRYLDLIANPDVKDTFIKRSKIITEIRKYLTEAGFLEVDTPILNNIAGGAAAKPFKTYHNALDMELFLRIAPELYLKRLIVGGLDKVFEMGRMFRNEGISYKHNPEFTMMELYQAYTDYEGMMRLSEDLISHVANTVLGGTGVVYQGTEIDLKAPFARMTMTEAVKKYAGIDFDSVCTFEEAAAAARSKGARIDKLETKGEIMNELFEMFAEENLIQPTFIYDYPVEISPLTKKKKGRPDLTERFEIFIIGREFGNAYSELNDPIDQKERFIRQAEKRDKGNDETYLMDDDFVVSLEYGLPPAGGLGIGIDRLIMLLTDSHSIRDVLLFPTMKNK
jgi:lysyl-tRNA synthetase, class II